MAFELKIQASTTLNGGAILQIEDVSVWADSSEGARGSYATFLTGSYRLSSELEEVSINPNEPESDLSWDVNTPKNGRYSFTAHAFYIKDTVVPNEGDVHYDPVADELVRWVSAAWVATTLEASLNDTIYTSGVLEVPYLSYAYSYSNLLNLEYIKQVKHDIQNGAQQNKLYYKRTDLDYFKSLITGGEYNWALGLYSNFYEITINLNSIIASGQIS